MVFSRSDRQRGRRRPPLVLLAGALGSAALAFSMTGTLSAFTAQIQNTTNTGATGMLAMQETLLDASGNPTSTVCQSNNGTAASVAANSATCATINKYGGTAVGLTPGGAANVTKLSIQNTGNVAATSFTLTPGSCTATAQTVNGGAATTSVCGKFKVTITSGATTIYSGFASAMPASINLLTALGQSSVAAGASIPLTFSVQLDSSADNTYAGFTISQPLTWTFTA